MNETTPRVRLGMGQQSLQPPAARMEVRPSSEWPPELVPAIATTARPAPRKAARPSQKLPPTREAVASYEAPMASEVPAMTKARASRFLENLRVFEDGVSALFGSLLGAGGGGVIAAGL